ncbi:hypothetical protein ACLOJK_014268 [Asimina triloba]
MDTFFISHGSPTLAIDESLPARHFLRSWQDKVFRPKPQTILMISAHWQTADPTVNVIDRNNDTIYDFYGFPKRMYQLKYPAPGAPKLAKRVKELLSRARVGRVKEDRARGLDHGAWVPLMLMYPKADIPVCQLSVQIQMDGSHHYNIGKALAPLRKEGVLIVGSGSATHNLQALGLHNGPVIPWAYAFDAWLEDSLVKGRHEDVKHYEEKAPNARLAHPSPDHFYPLHVALGAGGAAWRTKAELLHRSWEDASLSYASYRFKTLW